MRINFYDGPDPRPKPGITIDGQLNSESSNAVSNSAVTQKFADVEQQKADISYVDGQLAGKQDAISDLAAIRAGAAKGATAIQEHQSIKTINGQSIVGSGDVTIESGSIQNETDPTVPEVVKAITAEDISDWNSKGTYSKPGGGIPKGDLAVDVQASLSKADTAVQDISGKQDVISDLAAIRSGAEKGATAIQSHQSISHLATKTELNGKQDVISDLAAIRSGAAAGATAVQDISHLATKTELSAKQNTITDLAAIRSGAAAGATAVQDVSGKVDKVTGKGLSSNDYTTAEKNKLAGIAAGAEVNVQSDWNATSGDAFIKNKPTIPAAVSESTVSGWGFTKNGGTYSKPSGGIPKSDLASAVQSSLDKAESAVQDVSGKQDVISDLATIRSGAALGATAVQEHQQLKTLNGQSLVGSGNIVITPGTGGGGGISEESDPTVPYYVKEISQSDIAGWDAKGTYSKPSSGIPKSDLESAVQSSLGKADTAIQDISGKVDKVSGKGLSTNDYTTAEKNKLAGIAAGAEVNVQSDWNATSGDAMILNKPSIPVVDAELSETSTNAVQNKAVYQTLVQLSEFLNTIGNYAYYKPLTGIPKADLDASVQASLGKADTAIQSHQQIKTINGQSIIGSGDVTIETASPVTVDSTMSDTSTNPVQNKVVKGYVDGEIGDVEEIVDAINGTVSGVTDVTHFTIGEGLVVENGVLKCSFVPTRYYTGSAEPINTQGNNGDLYFKVD